jgi:hypothetical protein
MTQCQLNNCLFVCLFACLLVCLLVCCSYSNYSNEPIELVARRFQEIERHEREMARIREFERIQKERNFGDYRKLSDFDYYDRSPFEYDNTQSYRNNNNYVNPIRNDIFFQERENYFNYNDNYQQQKQQTSLIKRNWIEEDEEDELYFYGGGRKKKQLELEPKYQGEDEDEDEVYIQQGSPEFQEYDPADFETSSTVTLSSSWSTDSESDYEKTSKKKNYNTGTKIKSKSDVSTKDIVAFNSGIKPKAYAPKIVDLDAPTIIKLPPNPIPSTWAHIIHNPLKAIQKQLPSTTEILTKSISNRIWLQGLNLTNPVQGILMRPPFNDETFNIKHWSKFMQKLLPTVMPDGYLFIWVEREELADVIRAAEKYLSFKYVENLCWIRRDVGNRLMRESTDRNEKSGQPGLFYKSKMTLLILRRDPNNRCKLRHQRNPDCIFDFVGPGRMPDGRVYDVIETLLDGTKLPGPHLMHLWAGNNPTDRLVYQARKQWIRVLEVEDILEKEDKEDVPVEAVEKEETEAEMVTVITNDKLKVNEEPVETIKVDETLNFQSQTESENLAEIKYNNPVAVLNDKISTLVDPDSTIKVGFKIPDISTFDEDFCNFIICEPLSNC